MRNSFSDTARITPINSIFVTEVTFTLNGNSGEVALVVNAAKALHVNPLFSVMFLLNPCENIESLSQVILISFSSFLTKIAYRDIGSIYVSARNSIIISQELFFVIYARTFSYIWLCEENVLVPLITSIICLMEFSNPLPNTSIYRVCSNMAGIIQSSNLTGIILAVPLEAFNIAFCHSNLTMLLCKLFFDTKKKKNLQLVNPSFILSIIPCL